MTTVNIGEGSLPPIADAGGPYEAAPGRPVTFDARRSFDLDGEIVSYEWDFGDEPPGRWLRRLARRRRRRRSGQAWVLLPPRWS